MGKTVSTITAPMPSPARTRKRRAGPSAQAGHPNGDASLKTSEASTAERKTDKRRKVTPAPAKPAATSQTPLPQPNRTAGPSSLPPSLSFQLSDAIAHLSSHDARFAGMFRHLPCKPFQPPFPVVEPFRRLVTSIVGQQVSWMAAKAINGRFRAFYGFTDEDEGFPAPEVVAKSEVMALKGVGLSTRKAEYGVFKIPRVETWVSLIWLLVIALAEHFVLGTLSSQLLHDGTDEEVAKALITVRGIGQVSLF